MLHSCNFVIKFSVAVEKSGALVGQLTKGKSVRCDRGFPFFLRANHENSCSNVKRQTVKLNNAEGL